MKKKIPDINPIIEEIMSHNKRDRIGMIASHLGVVRGYSLNGKKVNGLEISFDDKTIKKITEKIKARDGIVDVNVRLNEGKLQVGDWVMLVVVAGETRGSVFPGLIDMVDMIKKDASMKKEIF